MMKRYWNLLKNISRGRERNGRGRAKTREQRLWKTRQCMDANEEMSRKLLRSEEEAGERA
jgi:hypothetical protein